MYTVMLCFAIQVSIPVHACVTLAMEEVGIPWCPRS